MSPLRNTATTPTQRRHMARVVTALGIAVAAGLTALTTACADGPGAPSEPRPALAPDLAATTTSGNELVAVTVLQRTEPLAEPITRSVTLTATGGTLSIPEAGLLVTIPRGAVGDTTVHITATALPGSSVAYEFEPHGAKFLTQLKVKQSLGNTSWSGNTGMMRVKAGYFADGSQLQGESGAARIDEEIEGTIAGNNFQFSVGHFSGYLVSTGRR